MAEGEHSAGTEAGRTITRAADGILHAIAHSFEEAASAPLVGDALLQVAESAKRAALYFSLTEATYYLGRAMASYADKDYDAGNEYLLKLQGVAANVATGGAYGLAEIIVDSGITIKNSIYGGNTPDVEALTYALHKWVADQISDGTIPAAAAPRMQLYQFDPGLIDSVLGPRTIVVTDPIVVRASRSGDDGGPRQAPIDADRMTITLQDIATFNVQQAQQFSADNMTIRNADDDSSTNAPGDVPEALLTDTPMSDTPPTPGVDTYLDSIGITIDTIGDPGLTDLGAGADATNFYVDLGDGLAAFDISQDAGVALASFGDDPGVMFGGGDYWGADHSDGGGFAAPADGVAASADTFAAPADGFAAPAAGE